MAGDWIPMRLDLCDDPAVLQMADILDQPEEYVVGCLHRVWSWASRNCHDGTVTGVTKMSLSRAVKLPQAVAAMAEVGWLVESKNEKGVAVIEFPKWENWLSKSAKSRLQNAMSQRISRESKRSKTVQKDFQHSNPVTGLSRSNHDKSVTTGKESTGEKKDTNPPLSPNGGEDPSKEKPKPRRKPSETIGEFQPPNRFDTPEVRQALSDFESMRLRTGKRIKDRSNVCRGWDTRFVDVKHLLACIDVAISNEYQGISPDYVDPSKVLEAKKPSLWDTAKKY